MIAFTRKSDRKTKVFNQFDHKYKFLYKDQVLWLILDAFDSKPKHVYRTRILEGQNIIMNVNDSAQELLMDETIYGYDNAKDQIIKIKSKKINESVFVDMSDWLEAFELRFSIKDKILFTDDFFNPVVRKDELTRSTYVFTDQLYKIIQYKDTIDVIQLTQFSERIPYLNIQKLKNGKMVKTFIIETNSKLIGDYITSITLDDYHLLNNVQFEVYV